MNTEHPGKVETLRSIRAFAQVFKYLRDERGWPLDADALDDDDLDSLTYDWNPEELDIAPGSLDALRRLRQMRPVTTSQPWGVFFLEFTGARLPITQVRRILRALVARKRGSGNGSRPSLASRRSAVHHQHRRRRDDGTAPDHLPGRQPAGGQSSGR